MKDDRDPGTAELPLPVRRGRGRPRKPDALSPAERARRYRERKRETGAAHHRAKASIAIIDGLRAELDGERRELEEADRLLKSQAATIARLRAELDALKNRDVTETTDDAHAWARALASLADLMRNFAKDKGAVASARHLRAWARTLDAACGRDVTKKR